MNTIHEIRSLLDMHESLRRNADVEIRFWLERFSEHLQLLQMGLVDSDLNQRAGRIYEDIEEFRRSLAGRDLAVVVKEVYQQCDLIRGFKQEILTKQQSGQWVGWLGPAFVKHMIEELDFFVLLLSDEVSPQSGAGHLIEMVAEHVDQLAQLIDPQTRGLVDDLRKKSEYLWKVHSAASDAISEKVLNAGYEACEKFDQWIRSQGVGTRKVLGAVPPLLAKHMQAEDEYMRNFLGEIKL